MSIMKWSLDTLRDQIPVSLNTGHENLLSAASILSSISIPSDFPCGGLLKNVANNVRGIASEVETSKAWVVQKANDIEAAESKNKEIANGAFGSLFADTPDFRTKGSGALNNPALDMYRGALEALIYTTIPEEGVQIENTREFPQYYQQGYPGTAFGSGTLAGGGCGVTSLAMAVEYLTGNTTLPPEMAAKYGRYYIQGTGSDWGIFNAVAEDYDLTVEQCFWGDWNNGAVDQALKEGKVVIVNEDVQNGSIFTTGGHYIVIYGITEDGKYLVRDPNKYNYSNPKLADGFENGFDPETVLGGASCCWIMGTEDGTAPTTTTTITREDLVNEGMRQAAMEMTSSDKNANTTSTATISDIKLDTLEMDETTAAQEGPKVEQVNITNNGWTGEKLTAGQWKYGDGYLENGPTGYETWYYDNDYNMTGVYNNLIEYYGFTDLEMRVREDGVYVLSGTKPNGETFTDLVMVAADVKHSTNPDGIFERGEIVETSRGTGIVVDYCELAAEKREKTGEIHLDIATIWDQNPELSMVGVETQTTTTTTKVPDTTTTKQEEPKVTTLTNETSTSKQEEVKTETTTGGKTTTTTTTTTTEPEYVEVQVKDGTSEAIINAAKNSKGTTSDSEYVCSVLNEAGYLSDEGEKQLKDYSINELCGQFDKFGWEKITNANELKAGDIIIINNGEGETTRIYAGNNKWYVAGETKVQSDANWAENSTWYAYRPSAGETGTTVTV